MENTFLPGTVRERLADLMKYHKVSQTDLALKIGCGDSLLSRFLTGKTDGLALTDVGTRRPSLPSLAKAQSPSESTAREYLSSVVT